MIDLQRKGTIWGSMSKDDKKWLNYLSVKGRIKLTGDDSYEPVKDYCDASAAYWHEDLLNDFQGFNAKYADKKCVVLDEFLNHDNSHPDLLVRTLLVAWPEEPDAFPVELADSERCFSIRPLTKEEYQKFIDPSNFWIEE